MQARMYALTGKTPKTSFKGQAARVYRELTTTPELAVTVNERIVKSDDPFKTRQDSYRVTLYYILIFKKQGLVAAFEPPTEASPVASHTTPSFTVEQLEAMLAALKGAAAPATTEPVIEATPVDQPAAPEAVEPVTEPVAEAVVADAVVEAAVADAVVKAAVAARVEELKAANARRGRK